MGGLQLHEHPEDERHQQSVRLRVPLAGLVIGLSLLAGAGAGILAYRYAAKHSKPGAESSAPAARVAPNVSIPATGEEPTAPPAAPENPAHSEKSAVTGQPAVQKIEPKLVDDHLQLTITLDEMVRYEAHRLENPDRIYIDLHGVHLAAELAGHNISVKQGGVADIRLGQIPPSTVRVVLDLDQRFDYSVTEEANPPAVILKLKPHATAHHKRHPSGHPQGAAARDGINRNS